LAVDLGERLMATTVLSKALKPKFYGREVRGIRRHYAWLRKRLQERKCFSTIKKVGRAERRKVNEVLHKVSRQIVNEAVANDSVIVLGSLKGIRQLGKGRRMNRIISNMPYFKLTKYIEYKALWEGIPVLKINERGTSRTCSRCGSQGRRPYQGLFICPSCGYQANADFNGTLNILKRSMEYISTDGASLTVPEPGRVSA